MQTELFSRSKQRFSDAPGDDIALVVPGLVHAVLDGATDPTGKKYNGESSGRLAARSAAQALVSLLLEKGPRVDMAQVGDALSQAVAKAAQQVGATHPPSTTLAAAITCPDGFRLVLIGDSGIRLNGSELFQNDKLIDDVSASARIAVRTRLAGRISDFDKLEIIGRRISYAGLDAAVDDGILTTVEADAVQGEVIARFAPLLGTYCDDLEGFLRGGIRVQPRFANDALHPLGFASINATPPQGFGITDQFVDCADCQSLEIFSDGYYGLPEGNRVANWETRFDEIEEEDPHKIHAFPEVKGSSSTEFSDDRTVLCLYRC
ncbi:protein phosphatase 2C domain-containing protein [Celeribacter halophilus]|uniref:protein phosphatase 2C domain-containing protein n=1 Tax=Celeribacter halophilus TaxID=576117 RepID=UPI001C08758F|nr:protein phosphatase 2C domain-containing protein [Celeribacter halophilus]MBU2888087.1 protein phosphatase 2C domain-containing protein [Celeribacter halophilus]MDO6511858.1 protein phosphatase 2C domain-containing protein [Celeribacter halophilus]